MRLTSRRQLVPVLFALVIVSAFVPRLSAADDDLKQLRDQIRSLEQKLLVLERNQEIKEEDTAAAAKAAPKISITDKGFTLASPDSASLGREKGASGRTAGYKTDGQQTFFSYATTTIADGQNWRLSPQFDYRNGSFGAIGEYVVSTFNVRPSATGRKAELQNKAWQLAAGYVLTGEDSSFTGVVPKTNFDFANGTWGAFELVARDANLKIDDAAFPLYASAAANADEASSYGVGLNWYLSQAVAFKFDYYQTNFGFARGAPAVSTNAILRQDEQSFVTRPGLLLISKPTIP